MKILKDLILPISIIFTFMVMSCSENFCESITEEMERQCLDKDSCTINFENVFTFQWDTIFMITEGHMNEEISKIIGRECNCKTLASDETMLIFLNEGKIVDKKVQANCRTSFGEWASIGWGFIIRNKPHNVKKNIYYEKAHYSFEGSDL